MDESREITLRSHNERSEESNNNGNESTIEMEMSHTLSPNPENELYVKLSNDLERLVSNVQLRLDNKIDKCMNQIRDQFQGPDVSNQAAENQNQSSHLQNSQAAGERYSTPIPHDDFRFQDEHRYTNPGGSLKLKPQLFDGADDIDEYLAQYEVVSKVNRWNNNQKGLYLSSSLTGRARSLLIEIDSSRRDDYETLVNILQQRYGSANKSELFRSQLQIRVRERGESLSELAQAIKRLTRKAYPTAGKELVETLSLDHYLDAIPDQDIRLRIREVGPKDISHAEEIAVRLEAHKMADRQRTKQVRMVEAVESPTKQLEKQVGAIEKGLRDLTREVRSMKQDNNNQSRNYNGSYQNHYQNQGQNHYQSPGQYNNRRPYHNNNGRNNNQGRNQRPAPENYQRPLNNQVNVQQQGQPQDQQ